MLRQVATVMSSEPYPPCHYLYTGPDCRQTYAAHLGTPYHVLQGFYICITAFCAVYGAYRVSRVVKSKGWLPLDLQKRVHAFSSIVVVRPVAALDLC